MEFSLIPQQENKKFSLVLGQSNVLSMEIYIMQTLIWQYMALKSEEDKLKNNVKDQNMI